jgi:transcriptional regulator GlxA family with amidase domain
VLFHVDFVPPPLRDLTVFDLDPLARALLAECGGWHEADEPLPAYPRAMFAALAAVAWRLAEQPSAVVVPAGHSAEVRTALRLTEERLGDQVRFEDVAGSVGLVPRSLARRFETEIGMPWRAVLRRMRVLQAIERLAADDTPVITIAHEVGYGSLSAFNAAFRELTGATPSDYRATFIG